ncbi:MAG: GNAT family N-acetyltransferase [Anaerolineales bacterium]|nr:GNAT family N-acetyltransferase [Anaerolineales bacterium]
MILGERIRLRAIERADLPRFVAWLNDPEVRRGLQMYLPLSQAEEEQWYEEMLTRPVDQHPLTIEVITEDGWVPIGNCGLFGIDWRVRQAEFGIFIGDRPSWNQGYGTDATRLMLQHAFETLNLNRIFLRVYENNPRAIRAYEKSGYVVEGRLRQAHYDEGAYYDVILMSVLRQDWQA